MRARIGWQHWRTSQIALLVTWLVCVWQCNKMWQCSVFSNTGVFHVAASEIPVCLSLVFICRLSWDKLLRLRERKEIPHWLSHVWFCFHLSLDLWCSNQSPLLRSWRSPLRALSAHAYVSFYFWCKVCKHIISIGHNILSESSLNSWFKRTSMYVCMESLSKSWMFSGGEQLNDIVE